MKKVQNILITLIFVGFIGLMGLLTFLLPAKRFSENENRYLQEFPTKITVKKIMDGSFIEKFSDYASDHVPLRDTWVHMKAALERASGRRENAGVLLGEEDTLFMIQKDPDPGIYERNLKAVNKFTESCSVPVYFGLIPTAASVWKDRMPAGAITADEDYYIDLMNQGSEATALDVSGVLKEHAGEYIFYRTDHHWTSLGALYGTNLILEELGLETIDRLVTTVTKTGGRFMLLAENEIYEARSVLLATGVVTSRGVPGEAELLGRGVSYCATCDGMFYRGKAIAVYCAGSRYAHEVEYLAGVASKVYLYSPERDLAVGGENVERLGSPIAGVEGHDRVESVRLGDGREIPVDGAFFLRSAISPASLVPGLALDGPHIVVDRQLRTGIEGCFAAGDCTGRPYQIAKAVGEGNVAAHQILEYLDNTL